MPLSEQEVFDGLMKLPGPCPKCEKEKWQGRVCEHCGHEEKVKPDCYYRVGVETGACAVCEWFKECPMQGHSEKVKP